MWTSRCRAELDRGTKRVPTPSPRYTVPRNVLNLGTQKWRHKLMYTEIYKSVKRNTIHIHVLNSNLILHSALFYRLYFHFIMFSITLLCTWFSFNKTPMQINQALDYSFQYRSLPPWTADKETPTYLCVSGTEKISSEVFVFHFLSLYNYISNTQR